ncbi:unnamed protein product, partial [Nesidiocoris tenuis]
MRGTDYEKLTLKSKTEFTAIVAFLYSKYSIRTTKPTPGAKRTLAPEVVTLPRIAAVAPHILTNLYYTRNAKTIFDLRKLGEGAMPVLGTTFLASCFPHIVLNAERTAHRVLFCIHVLSDRVIHRKTSKFTKFNDMMNYYLAAVRSNAVREDKKISWCLKWGILRLTTGAAPIVKESSSRKINLGMDDFEPYNWDNLKLSRWFTQCIGSCIDNVKDMLSESEVMALNRVIAQLESELV